MNESSVSLFSGRDEFETGLLQCNHRQPKLCGSSLDFEFVRECMKINEISPKFQFGQK